MRQASLSLLEWHEAGGLGGTNTGGTVLDRLVGDGELTEVVSNHVSLNINLVEDLAVVNTDDRSDHLREDDHVTEVGLDALWLLAFLWLGNGLLGGPKTLEEGVVLALETVLETATGTSVNELHEVSHWHHEEVLEVDSTVGVLAERLL